MENIRHIAIIMDGNGRWAKKQNKPRIYGHKEGMSRVKEIVQYSRNLGLDVLSLFAFSSENWFRPKSEVSFLMALLEQYLKSEVAELKENGVKLNFIGNIKKLPPNVCKIIEQSLRTTEDCSDMLLNIALSYGGREELLSAVKSIAYDCTTGKISPEDINDTLFSNYLYTKSIPDPDLLIRTSGEMRISNFMLWQIAYTELYITDTLWPDFNSSEFAKAIDNYNSRERRFGKISEQINGEQ